MSIVTLAIVFVAASFPLTVLLLAQHYLGGTDSAAKSH